MSGRGGIWRTLWLAAAVVAAAAPARAADPFYERLLETGISYFAAGDYPNAVEDLRLACFGLLDEPSVLAECVAYLAVAEAESGDVDAFGRTIDRLLEVERRFEAYSALDLDTGLAGLLENHLVSFVPFEVLVRYEVFRDAARRKRLAEIRAMPPAERRGELERRLAAEPDDSAWRLMMAQLDLAEGELEAAWTAAGRLLEHDAQRPTASCVRGRAGAALGWCELALADLAACDPGDAVSELIEARLRCQLRLQDLPGAAATLAELPAAERQQAPFRQLARELTRAQKEAARAPSPASPAAGEPEAVAEDPAAGSAGGVPAEAGGDETVAGETAAADPAVAELDGGDPEAGAPEPAAVAEVLGPAVPPGAPVDPEPESSGVAAAEAAERAERDRLLAELERAGELVGSGSRGELERAFGEMRALADSNPGLPEAQVLAGEIAYRLSRWEDAVTYFRRAGDLERPERQFYFAVALYESGERVAAKELLDRCIRFLEPTEFVRSYSEKILNRG